MYVDDSNNTNYKNFPDYKNFPEAFCIRFRIDSSTVIDKTCQILKQNISQKLNPHQ